MSNPRIYTSSLMEARHLKFEEDSSFRCLSVSSWETCSQKSDTGFKERLCWRRFPVCITNTWRSRCWHSNVRGTWIKNEIMLVSYSCHARQRQWDCETRFSPKETQFSSKENMENESRVMSLLIKKCPTRILELELRHSCQESFYLSTTRASLFLQNINIWKSIWCADHGADVVMIMARMLWRCTCVLSF